MGTSKTPAACSRKPYEWITPIGIPEEAFSKYADAADRVWEQDINYIPAPIYILDVPNIYIGTPIIIDDRRAEVIVVENLAN